MTEHLPGLNISSPSPRATDAAKTLLRGFHFQDRREDCLKARQFDAAQQAATRAIDLMGQSYQLEFPSVPDTKAYEAGELFMRALFLQDEIENWADFSSCPEADLPTEAFVTADTGIAVRSIDADPRWDDVRNLLVEVCRRLEMDEEFATLQTRFWWYHGQKRTDWQTIAFRAHCIKIRRMVPRADDRTVANLARYFVAGVETHDEWNRADVDHDISMALDVVSRYYEQIFDLI
ncbi:hypothetical protein ACFQJC_07855 [Haloferax namakaokahaiae]|uniref:Uncharacterized protein n=1 Tax=Haloferax namakaokahaiae TaxID=1748331 RepID=A0ABD5ZDQ5_9EURY